MSGHALTVAEVGAIQAVIGWALDQAHDAPEPDDGYLDFLADEGQTGADVARLLGSAVPKLSRMLLEDWKYEVANGDTYLGYQEWCEAQTAGTS